MKSDLEVKSWEEKIQLVEKELLKHDQVNCPVMHHFGPGTYIREVFIPAGSIAIGHYQKFEHMNIFLKGRVTIINDDGSLTELQAPMMFTGKPGRKIGYIHEDMTWINIYPTNETNVEKLEETYLEKSVGWKELKELTIKTERLKHDIDREDYIKVLSEFGFTHEMARIQSENTDDQITMPYGTFNIKIDDSPIEGKGLFATADFNENDFIAPARINGLRTLAGRYVNHSTNPNAKMIRTHDDDINLIAIKKIKGCTGGNNGDEITVDYRQALSLSLPSSGKGELICQQ